MESASPMTRRSSLAMCATSCTSTPASSRGLRLRSRPSVRAIDASCFDPGGEGVDDGTGHIVRHRRGGQTGTGGQLAQQGPHLVGFLRVQGPYAVQAQAQRRRGYRFQQQRTYNGKQREPQAAFPKRQSPCCGCDPDHGQDQQPGLQAVESAVLQERRARITGMMTGHAQRSRRRGRRACSAASRSHPEPAWRLPARLSLRGSRRSRGSRTCGRVRSARSGPPS